MDLMTRLSVTVWCRTVELRDDFILDSGLSFGRWVGLGGGFGAGDKTSALSQATGRLPPPLPFYMLIEPYIVAFFARSQQHSVLVNQL
eukprot:2376278-Amphidinium_carterae.1